MRRAADIDCRWQRLAGGSGGAAARPPTGRAGGRAARSASISSPAVLGEKTYIRGRSLKAAPHWTSHAGCGSAGYGFADVLLIHGVRTPFLHTHSKNAVKPIHKTFRKLRNVSIAAQRTDNRHQQNTSKLAALAARKTES